MVGKFLFDFSIHSGFHTFDLVIGMTREPVTLAAITGRNQYGEIIFLVNQEIHHHGVDADTDVNFRTSLYLEWV